MYVYNFMGYRRFETGKLRPDGQPGFNTVTGKLELRSTLLEALGYHDLPFFEEPPESPSCLAPVDDAEFLGEQAVELGCIFDFARYLAIGRELGEDHVADV